MIITYLGAHSREEAAERLYLTSSTYYRWLGRAVEQLADILYLQAVELAKQKYITD